MNRLLYSKNELSWSIIKPWFTECTWMWIAFSDVSRILILIILSFISFYFLNLFIYNIYSFIYSFIHLFIYSFLLIYPLIHLIDWCLGLHALSLTEQCTYFV